MDKCKPAETPIALGTKLTKNDGGPIVNATLYKRMVGSLMYLTAFEYQREHLSIDNAKDVLPVEIKGVC